MLPILRPLGLGLAVMTMLGVAGLSGAEVAGAAVRSDEVTRSHRVDPYPDCTQKLLKKRDGTINVAFNSLTGTYTGDASAYRHRRGVEVSARPKARVSFVYQDGGSGREVVAVAIHLHGAKVLCGGSVYTDVFGRLRLPSAPRADEGVVVLPVFGVVSGEIVHLDSVTLETARSARR